jgi:transaldolase
MPPAPTASPTPSVAQPSGPGAPRDGYFQRVHRETPTRLWINNPTPAEARQGLLWDAISCTTNPTYTAKILRQMPEAERVALLAQVHSSHADPDQAVDALQRMVLRQLLPIFAPYQMSATPYAGLVSIQGNPHRDTDSDHILHEAAGYAKLGPNVIFKVPATRAGLVAIEELLRQGKPVLATEMMSVAQVVAACACYQRVMASTAKRPILILTHITGIYDQFLAEEAARLAPELPMTVVAEAGFLVARRAAEVLARSGLPIGIMGGGARRERHFTDLVGGPYQVTLNPDTIETLVTRDEPVIQRFKTACDQRQVELLCHHLPNFRCAWEDDGLRPEEFELFGPIRLFLGMFVKGWDEVRAQLPQRQQSQRS